MSRRDRPGYTPPAAHAPTARAVVVSTVPLGAQEAVAPPVVLVASVEPEPVPEPSAPPAGRSARYVAQVTVYAGGAGTFCPGDELPESIALDGLRAGEHYTLEP